MSVYIHTYMYIYLNILIYMYVCIYMYVYTNTFTDLNFTYTKMSTHLPAPRDTASLTFIKLHHSTGPKNIFARGYREQALRGVLPTVDPGWRGRESARQGVTTHTVFCV